LAELVDELGEALRVAPVPPEEVARLAGTTAQLAEALHHHDRGWLESARDRFDEAVVQTEAHAPVAVRLARRLADSLGSMGIGAGRTRPTGRTPARRRRRLGSRASTATPLARVGPSSSPAELQVQQKRVPGPLAARCRIRHRRDRTRGAEDDLEAA